MKKFEKKQIHPKYKIQNTMQRKKCFKYIRFENCGENVYANIYVNVSGKKTYENEKCFVQIFGFFEIRNVLFSNNKSNCV